MRLHVADGRQLAGVDLEVHCLADLRFKLGMQAHSKLDLIEHPKDLTDLALIKAEGRFAALPVAASRGVKLGGTVATIQVKKAE